MEFDEFKEKLSGESALCRRFGKKQEVYQRLTKRLIGELEGRADGLETEVLDIESAIAPEESSVHTEELKTPEPLMIEDEILFPEADANPESGIDEADIDDWYVTPEPMKTLALPYHPQEDLFAQFTVKFSNGTNAAIALPKELSGAFYSESLAVAAVSRFVKQHNPSIEVQQNQPFCGAGNVKTLFFNPVTGTRITLHAVLDSD